MFEDEGGDPHIVCRDGCGLLTQLPVNGGVVMRRLVVSIEHADTGLQQKNGEGRLRCVAPRSLRQIRPATLLAR
jgi:hypothetical protein